MGHKEYHGMSEANLTVGPLPSELERAASEAISRLGAKRPSAPGGGFETTHISIFNLASVVLFTDHVAQLEGFQDSGVAMEKTKFLNLPWWQTSIWIPIVFRPPKEPAINMEGWPVFLGSCEGLLADLAEVRKLSAMNLGTIPEGYARMRTDYAGFMRSGFEISDERSIIQWVWLGLHDSAQLALSASALMLDMA
jgi:hypothetical protein